MYLLQGSGLLIALTFKQHTSPKRLRDMVNLMEKYLRCVPGVHLEQGKSSATSTLLLRPNEQKNPPFFLKLFVPDKYSQYFKNKYINSKEIARY